MVSSEDVVKIDLSAYSGVDFYTVASWFKGADKILEFITTSGTFDLRTKQFFNDSGKLCDIKVRNDITTINTKK